MAAHILTALKEVHSKAKAGNYRVFDDLRPALALSCWTEDLDYQVYLELAKATEDRDLARLLDLTTWALSLLEDWFITLGYPRTREDWVDAKWRLHDQEIKSPLTQYQYPRNGDWTKGR